MEKSPCAPAQGVVTTKSAARRLNLLQAFQLLMIPAPQTCSKTLQMWEVHAPKHKRISQSAPLAKLSWHGGRVTRRLSRNFCHYRMLIIAPLILLAEECLSAVQQCMCTPAFRVFILQLVQFSAVIHECTWLLRSIHMPHTIDCVKWNLTFRKSNHWTRSMNNSVNCLSACVLETADISMTSFVIRSDVEGYSGIVPRSFRFLKCLNKATGFSPYLRTSSGDTTFAGSMLSQNHSKNGTTASCSNVQSKASPWNSLAFG